ncbi:hypothetical protein PG995_007816 [Apiospora arundinis]
MDRIPAEITLTIVRLLVDESPESAYTYATVSRAWQAFIEAATFASIKLDQGRLSQAKETLTPARQAYVRQIQFTALLPDYHNQAEPRDSESDKKQNDEAFSDAVVSLMGLLSTWSSPHDGGIELKLSTACTIDLQDMKRGSSRLLPNRRDRLERCVTSYVALREGLYRRLPEVSLIKTFTSSPMFLHHRRLTPKTWCEIASRFPRLRSINWEFADGSHDPAFRLQLRNDFATGLFILPESVRDFTLCYRSGPGLGRFFNDPGPRICPGVVRDPLSVALGKLSMQMEEMSLDMVIGSELLWDPALPPDEQGHWPLLREIQLNLNQNGRTPQGDEIFDWDDEVADSDSDTNSYHPPRDYERAIPIPAQFNVYQLAFARAAARMPNLRSLYITLGDRLGCFENYTVQPGKGVDRGSRAEFLYEGASVAPDLITQETQEEWCNAARVHLGEGGKFDFKVVDNGALLEFRHYKATYRSLTPYPPERTILEYMRVV